MHATPHLGLPLLAAAQAQKHVTHNEALIRLDALVQLAVRRRDLALAPASPAEGDRYIVAAGAAGAWAGHGGEIAHWADGLWRYHRPEPGWLAYVVEERAMVAWTGSLWGPALAALGEIEVARIGIGTPANPANPLNARLDRALLAARGSAEGGSGSVRLALSKEAAGGVASLVLQDAFSGRAEIGLVGDDDFSLKVSADGQAWTEALRVDRLTGQVRFPAGAFLSGGGRNRLVNGAFTVNQRGHPSGAALAPGAYGHDRWRAGPAGCTYTAAPGAAEAVLTLQAGTLVQVVEPGAVEGGAYVLHWTGSAVGRVGVGGAAPSGEYRPSPLVVADAPPGQAVAVEFAAGTLGRVGCEPGRAATPFERRHPALELLLCQRTYAKTFPPDVAPGHGRGPQGAVMAATGSYSGSHTGALGWRFPVTMRATPSIAVHNPTAPGQAGQAGDAFGAAASAPVTTVPSPDGVLAFIQAGSFTPVVHYTASAEL